MNWDWSQFWTGILLGLAVYAVYKHFTSVDSKRYHHKHIRMLQRQRAKAVREMGRHIRDSHPFMAKEMDEGITMLDKRIAEHRDALHEMDRWD